MLTLSCNYFSSGQEASPVYVNVHMICFVGCVCNSQNAQRGLSGVFILKTRHNLIYIKTENYFSTGNKVVSYVENGRETFDWLVPSQLIS